ncbi:MAG TPA: tripartite tricarboxylate transporter substrate binding protein [Burkholderiales bacterium]|nr:tripartite tricarboxylate transporter substrate binding protein [Burkholderiales bacterium]
MIRVAKHAALALCLMVPYAGGAMAQPNYPAKPIRFIVPFPPGGGTDILSRLVTNKLTERLGWQIVVDNKPGAGGNIGLDLAAKAPADGYTLVMGQTSNLAINPTLYSKLPYDSLKDFAPITLVSSVPLAVTVASKSQYTSLASLVNAAKAKPDQLVFASPGNGTVAHLTGEMFQHAAGVKFVHVPYKGASQAIPDLIGGRVNFYMSSLETAMPQIKGGNIRAVAVSSLKRSPSLPEVPTIAESGYRDFESSTWFGVLAPAGTPPAVIARLSDEITKVLQLPDVRDKMVDGGGDIRTGPAAFSALLKADLPKWARIVKASGAKVD